MMTIELIAHFLGWCFVINYGVLIFWFLFFTLRHEQLFSIHSRWFDISVERFDAAHYFLLGFYKLCIVLFNVTPYLVLKFFI
jgi:hypothetical protein